MTTEPKYTDAQIEDVCAALLNQRQCDYDGMECIVSREAACMASNMLRSLLSERTHTHPARSGVVSDEDVRDAIVEYQIAAGITGVNTRGLRAALEHFAKGEHHER